MHYRGFVVTVCDAATKRPFREFDHHRDGNDSAVRLVVPFDTEYAFNFKVLDGTRRRLDITIDGTAIGTSSLVCSGWGSSILERFLDSDRRFKFVPATANGVADPTSADNGIIVIRSHAERRPDPFFGHTMRAATFSGGYVGGVLYGANTGDVVGATLNATNSVFSACSAGATVEGSRSDQVISSTSWRGDDHMVAVDEFRFKLVGPITGAEVGLHCTECGSKLRKADRFCGSCGTRVTVAI